MSNKLEATMNLRNIKSLAIYVVYDKDGIIDDYIPYYLQELCQNVSHIVIVCNGKLTDEGRNKLKAFTQDIFVRSNTGFDCGAVKDVLFNLYGWDKVYEYDELLIVNDTVYGPLYPFKRVFFEMDQRDVDFWGLTLQGVTYDLAYTDKAKHLVPEYVQSYFINVKKRLLHSSSFYAFWTELSPESLSFTQAIQEYEIAFTTRFSREGYSYGAYTDTSNIFSKDPALNNIATHIVPLALVRDCGAPCIKKKSFTYERAIKLNHGKDARPNEVMRYIRSETGYDENLIWDNLLRTTPEDIITQNLNLYFILQNDDDIKRLADEQPRLGMLADTQGRVIWRRPSLSDHSLYYKGIIFVPDEAAARIADMEYMLARLFEQIPEADGYFGLLNVVRRNVIREFCQKHRNIYLYGAGGEAERWAEVMEGEQIRFNGFVISDGQPKDAELMGHRIVYLSEITEDKDDCGLILTLNPRNSCAVREFLASKGFKYILRLN